MSRGIAFLISAIVSSRKTVVLAIIVLYFVKGAFDFDFTYVLITELLYLPRGCLMFCFYFGLGNVGNSINSTVLTIGWCDSF